MEGAGTRCFAAYQGIAQIPAERLRTAVAGRMAIAFAGFLSNGQDLARRLDGPPPVDEAELILRLRTRMGEAAFAELRGGFALLCWDGDHDELTATHDQVGTHPIFWAQSSDAVLYSDSTETLLARPGVSRELNRLALADHIRWQWPDPQETFFAAVRRVPAGNSLTDRSGRREVYRTWDPAPTPIQWATGDEVAQFDELFERAVERCFHLGQVGISLSGGLDSVTVAAFAAQVAERRGFETPMALSVRFPDAGVNEETIQRSVASQLGFKMTMVDLDEAVAPLGVLEATLELAKSWPYPMFNPWLPAYVSLGHIGRRQGVDAFVTGGGGDEWLCVSPALAADLMASFDVAGLYRLVAGARRSHRMSTALILKCYLWTFGIRPVGRRLLGMAPSLLDSRDRKVLARSTQSWLAPDPELRRAIDARFKPRGAPRRFYMNELREALEASIVAQEMEEFFELGRRIQTPVVRPFLDPDVINLLARVPPDVLNSGGRTKALVRQTLDDRFPDLQFGQQRKVQAIPTLERVLRDQFDELWASIGPPWALAGLGIVDLPKLEATVAQMKAEPYVSLWRLFMLQSLEVFARARL